METKQTSQYAANKQLVLAYCDHYLPNGATRSYIQQRESIKSYNAYLRCLASPSRCLGLFVVVVYINTTKIMCSLFANWIATFLHTSLFYVWFLSYLSTTVLSDHNE